MTSLTPAELGPFAGFAKNTVEQMRNDLLKVYSLWEQGKHSQMFTSGICKALDDVVELRLTDSPCPWREPSYYCAYAWITKIRNLIEGPKHSVFLHAEDPNDGWEQRATMCLLMAEFITTEILEA